MGEETLVASVCGTTPENGHISDLCGARCSSGLVAASVLQTGRPEKEELYMSDLLLGAAVGIWLRIGLDELGVPPQRILSILIEILDE